MTDEIQRSLGRIEGKLDALLDRYDDDIPDLKAGVSDFRNFKGKVVLLVALVSSVVTAFGSQLANWIKGA